MAMVVAMAAASPAGGGQTAKTTTMAFPGREGKKR